MKKFDGYLSQITSFLDGAYSQGYTDGYERGKTLLANMIEESHISNVPQKKKLRYTELNWLVGALSATNR